MQSNDIRNSINGSGDNLHTGFLSVEQAEGSDNFVRRFFVLDQRNGRLEFFADDCSVGVNVIRFYRPVSLISLLK
jgi:hypothetical protein